MPFIADTSASDPSYPLFPIMASLAIVMVLMPAYWHFKSGNVGTILYIVWALIGNIIYLVNSIVWNNNLRNPSWFWCDLCTKLMIGLSVGMPTASLIINRRLYLIATIRSVQVSRTETRRASIIEAIVGVGLPLIVMALHVVVQGHRFDIFEAVGCWPSTYFTPLAIPMVMMWPILLGLVSLVYAVLSIRAFLIQRRQFSAVLQSSNTGLNASRYFRLMALASTEICFALPFSIYILVNNLLIGIKPWISWEDTHADFNRTEYVPFGIFILLPRSWILVNVTRYSVPVGAYFFFAYLGLSGESGVFYRRQFWKLAGLFGIKHSTPVTPGTSWVGRSQGTSQMRSLPPFATTASFTSTTKKDGRSRSSSDSLDDYLEKNADKDIEKASTTSSDPPEYLSAPPELPTPTPPTTKEVV